MTKKTQSILFIVCIFILGCDENKTVEPPVVCAASSTNESLHLSGFPPPEDVILYTTEFTNDSCYAQIIETAQVLNSTPKNTNESLCHYNPTRIYSVRDSEQKFFTDKESLTNEEIKNHIKNACSANYYGLPVQEFISIELEEGQFNFTYEFMGELYEGQVITQESDQFACPVFTATCSISGTGEIIID